MPSSKPIVDSPSYVKASEDLELLQRDELRAIRLQLELLKPELYQREQQIESTIVAPEPEPCVQLAVLVAHPQMYLAHPA